MDPTPITFDPCGFYVYVLWGTDALTPLYVGSSSNVAARVGTHVGNAQEKPFFERVELHAFATYEAMRSGELRMIAAMEPEWNVTGLPGRAERSAKRAAVLGALGGEGPRFHLGPCLNCGREMSRMDGDRPRAGRCEACYRYLARTGSERPPELCPRGQDRDRIVATKAGGAS